VGNLVSLRLKLSDKTLYDHVGTLDFSDVKVDPTIDTIALRGTIPDRRCARKRPCELPVKPD
jgi:hypothetical protein